MNSLAILRTAAERQSLGVTALVAAAGYPLYAAASCSSNLGSQQLGFNQGWFSSTR